MVQLFLVADLSLHRLIGISLDEEHPGHFHCPVSFKFEKSSVLKGTATGDSCKIDLVCVSPISLKLAARYPMFDD